MLICKKEMSLCVIKQHWIIELIVLSGKPLACTSKPENGVSKKMFEWYVSVYVFVYLCLCTQVSVYTSLLS